MRENTLARVINICIKSLRITNKFGLIFAFRKVLAILQNRRLRSYDVHFCTVFDAGKNLFFKFIV